MEFDPKCPCTLILAPSSSSKENDKVASSSSFGAFQSEDGTGCNPEESSALMKLLDVEADESSSLLSSSSSSSSLLSSNKTICRKYRRSIVDCLVAWENRLAERKHVNDDNDDKDDEDNKTDNNNNNNNKNSNNYMNERANLELLKISHNVTHLSEIYLLDDDNDHDDHDDDGLGRVRRNVTADTVRYLRLNHMADAVEEVAPLLGPELFGDVGKLLELPQPEYYLPGDDNHGGNDTDIIPPFWVLLRKLVLRGCLEDAWAVLSAHSACRRCANDFDGYEDPTLEEDRDAFGIIQSLLLSAPLPGGRTDFYDDGLHHLNDDDNDNEDHNNNDNDNHKEWIPGIPCNAYKLWDRSHASREYQYNLLLANNVFQSWKNNVSQSLKTNPCLVNLTRRVPLLNSCLFDILLSKSPILHTNTNTHTQHLHSITTWAELLASELLYTRPTIAKDDIHVRALSAIRQCREPTHSSHSPMGGIKEIVLSIMKGDAGRVIETLHGVGGGSGAALPATITALLCKLLTKANQIYPNLLDYDLQTELLLNAASAIQSSFAVQNRWDIGVRLSTRLLLPHALSLPSRHHNNNNNQWGDEPRNRMLEHLALLLGRHHPKTDVEAGSLLHLCRSHIRCCLHQSSPSIRTGGGNSGGRRMAEALESIALCRYRYHIRTNEIGNAVVWLLKGLECASLAAGKSALALESVVGGGACMRHLVELCSRATYCVLEELVWHWNRDLMMVRHHDDDLDDYGTGDGEENMQDDNNNTRDRKEAFVTVMRRARQIVDAIANAAKEEEEESGGGGGLQPQLDVKWNGNDSNDGNGEKLGGGTTTTSAESASLMLVHREPVVRLLQNIVEIGLSTVSGDVLKVAKCIVDCLEEKIDERNGVVSTLAHPSLYGAFLSLSHSLLRTEEFETPNTAAVGESTSSSLESGAAFDVHGIHILMARFTEYTNSEDAIQNISSTEPYIGAGGSIFRKNLVQVPELRLELSKGLMRAFIAENFKLSLSSSLSSPPALFGSAESNAPPLLSMEQSVELMLGPSLM